MHSMLMGTLARRLAIVVAASCWYAYHQIGERLVAPLARFPAMS